MNERLLRAKLIAAGFDIIGDRRNGDDTGWRLDLDCGAIVNLYDTGKVNVQGTNTRPVRELIEGRKISASTQLTTTGKVFVVGRDGKGRTRLEAVLKHWHPEPLAFDQLTCGGQTIVEEVQRARHEADYAVVLATPDDEGHKKNKPGEKGFRARQ